ncbi:hypothetical protein JYT51_01320 [Candidatus Amoebophilus asiaticus]|nr:hypothetical protein [Candidatus Amoebophilus asiaticus]
METLTKFSNLILVGSCAFFFSMLDVNGQIVHRDDINLKEGKVTAIMDVSTQAKTVKVVDNLSGQTYISRPTSLSNISVGSDVLYHEVVNPGVEHGAGNTAGQGAGNGTGQGQEAQKRCRIARVNY